MVGCEVALQLSHLGYAVDIIEMAPLLAPDGIYTERVHTMHFIDHDPNITVHTASTCVEIQESSVVIKSKDGALSHIPAEAVVLCAGMRSLTSVADQFQDMAFDVIYAGDCRKIGTVCSATASGYDAAVVL